MAATETIAFMPRLRGKPDTSETRLVEGLARCFPQDAQAWREHLRELLSKYKASGLAPPNLIEEIETGDPRKAYAHLWEALLYQHFSSLDHLAPRTDRPSKSGQKGPDFCFAYNGKRVWVEATVLSPGIDSSIWGNWLEPPMRGVITVKAKPHEQILCRWTTRLSSKRNKMAQYLEENKISKDDCVIIAINSCMLHTSALGDFSQSRFPMTVEAVLPISVAAPIETDGNLGTALNVPRFAIQSKNGSLISTANFLDPAYACISALVSSCKCDLLHGGLKLTLVHNPLAINKLPQGIFGVSEEYVTLIDGNAFTIRKI